MLTIVSPWNSSLFINSWRALELKLAFVSALSCLILHHEALCKCKTPWSLSARLHARHLTKGARTKWSLWVWGKRLDPELTSGTRWAKLLGAFTLAMLTLAIFYFLPHNLQKWWALRMRNMQIVRRKAHIKNWYFFGEFPGDYWICFGSCDRENLLT